VGLVISDDHRGHHRRPVRSGNPLERPNEEINAGPRSWILPARASFIRLVGMVLAGQDDEWQDGRRYVRSETMAVIDVVIEHEEASPALMIAS
jgi:transposase-like protein